MTVPPPYARMTVAGPPVLPKVPHATLALVLGIVSVAGSVLLVPACLGPLAWYLGASARRQADREPGRWSGAGEARTGMVLGIVGTVLLAVILLVLALVLAGMASLVGYDSGYGS